MQETDLYQPVLTYLEHEGYQVQAEVNHCDIVATKDDEMMIVELKTSLNLTLLLQAIDRQSISSCVYIAIPETRNKRSKKWRNTLKLLKKLGLGLMLVNLASMLSPVKVALEPTDQTKPNARRKRQLHKELDGRSGNYNQAGTGGKKLMTAYRENSVYLVWCLAQMGASRIASLRLVGGGQHCDRILRDNHYGWFEKVSRGIYQITDEGRLCLRDYPELIIHCENKFVSYSQPPSDPA